MDSSTPAARPGTVAYMAEVGGAPGRAFKGFIDAVYADTTLDAKTRELVFIAVQTAADSESSVRAHVPRAIKAGATKAEIIATMLVATANGGCSGPLRMVALIDDMLK